MGALWTIFTTAVAVYSALVTVSLLYHLCKGRKP